MEEQLNKLQIRYDSIKKKNEQKLLNKIYFEFELVHHNDYSGWCVLNLRTSSLATLKRCLNHISKYKFLNEYDHNKLST